MALTNTPKDGVTSLQVMLDIAQSLKTIADGDLEKTIKTAYALPESELAKANEARDSIARYESLVAQSKTEKAASEKAKQDALDAKDSLQASIDNIASENQKLDEREEALDAVAENQKQSAKNLENAASDLNAKLAKFAKDSEELEVKKQKMSAYEESLKSTAESIKGLTKGL